VKKAFNTLPRKIHAPGFAFLTACLVLLSVPFLWAQAPSDSVQAAVVEKRAVVITLEETVDPGMAAYTSRAIQEAVEKEPDYIIFEVNTFGGELMAAFEITDEISSVPDSITTVAIVHQKAISAGALISLACNQLYMKPTTTIGDVAPVVQGQQGPVVLGEKIQSPLRAKFRNFAQKNGYPELLSQAMVTKELEVLQITQGDSVRFLEKHEYEELTEEEKNGWSSPKTVVKKDELLTMTNLEAEKWGFSRGTVKDLPTLKSMLNVKESTAVEISWAESVARVLRMLAPLLMLLGFGAIYMEFQTPGFGVFGVAGILFLGLVFGGQAIAHLTGQLPLILLIFGAILLLVETLFLPGTYVSGAAGTGLIMASIILVTKETSLPWQSVESTASLPMVLLWVLGTAVASLMIPLVAGRWILPLLPGDFSVIQSASLSESVVRNVSRDHELKAGDEGIAETPFHPTGKARFGKKILDAEAAEGYIDKGQKIKLVRRNGNFLTVRALKENQES